jgi:RNA recognition motif-containing protein
MAKKLYVGNLSFTATADQVREHFQVFGEVTNVNVVMDSFSGRSRGFAFVEMADEAAADKAREAYHGKPFQNRTLTVDWARPDTRGEGGPSRPRGGEYERSGRRF